MQRPNLEDLARLILPRPKPGRFFSEQERKTALALAEVVLEGSPVRLPLTEVIDNVEAFLLRGRSQRAWRLRVLYTLVEAAPLALGKRPFSRLSLSERRALVEERFVHGRYLWTLCAKARHLIYLGAYADPRAAGQVGFVPVPERERYRGPTRMAM